jgi:hypothetical protein
MAEREEAAIKLAGRPFNLGSPKQLGEILYDEMGIGGGKKTKTGAYATGAEVLEELAAQGHELPQVILDWRQPCSTRRRFAGSTNAAGERRKSSIVSKRRPRRLQASSMKGPTSATPSTVYFAFRPGAARNSGAASALVKIVRLSPSPSTCARAAVASTVSPRSAGARKRTAMCAG